MNSDFDFLPPEESPQPYTVSQINSGVAAKIESGNVLIWFEGEISNCRRHSSGHCYLTLKDDQSQISAVIWRSNVEKVGFIPEDGMGVTGVASLRVYKKGGTYQLDIHRMQPSGAGALAAAFEKLKKKLEKEGLFKQERKRPLPRTIKTLGVITSRTGAVLSDIVRVVKSRAPQTDIVLLNVPVQGEGAAPRIARAIADMNRHGGVECIILARGGGSLEDLWPFNEEVTARAIFASEIPVISAVGHETDFTIADFVADVRAPTPSAAAEMAVPDTEENRRYFLAAARTFCSGYLKILRDKKYEFTDLARRPALRHALSVVTDGRQSLDIARQRQYQALSVFLKDDVSQLRSAAGRLAALSPLNVLARGYSVVTLPDGSVVRNAADLTVGSDVVLRLRKGKAGARIHEVTEESE